MHDDFANQILVPPSFQAVHADTRGRLTLPRDEFHQRYELCEDMAQMLVEPSQETLHRLGLAEDIVLERTLAGLQGEDSAFLAAEAAWVVTRLAELLGWPWHALPEAPQAPEAARRSAD